MLFILVADVLQKLFQAVEYSFPFPKQLSPKFPQSVFALQYASDTSFLAVADDRTLTTVKIILRIFAKASWLNINLAKSMFTPINLDTREANRAMKLLTCKMSTLPCNYLGLPLAIKRLRRQNFTPLIEKVK